MSEVDRFTLLGCEQPSKVVYHRPADRLLVACRGAQPALQILDPADGRLVTALPIATGVDGLMIDDNRARIVASGDQAFTVIEHAGDDSYRRLGDVATRPGAKIMTMDKVTGNIFLVAAGRTERASDTGEVTTVYHPDSFTVLRYAAR
ncbi:MAG: hypothetical protein IE932_00100 [Sphingopyxis terrae]|nr:hypothetical protein [Sphingopyxis terrae]